LPKASTIPNLKDVDRKIKQFKINLKIQVETEPDSRVYKVLVSAQLAVKDNNYKNLLEN
jgi:hypothetical protein